MHLPLAHERARDAHVRPIKRGPVVPQPVERRDRQQRVQQLRVDVAGLVVPGVEVERDEADGDVQDLARDLVLVDERLEVPVQRDEAERRGGPGPPRRRRPRREVPVGLARRAAVRHGRQGVRRRLLQLRARGRPAREAAGAGAGAPQLDVGGAAGCIGGERLWSRGRARGLAFRGRARGGREVAGGVSVGVAGAGGRRDDARCVRDGVAGHCI